MGKGPVQSTTLIFLTTPFPFISLRFPSSSTTMASPLTAGFCQLVHASEDSPEGVKPTLQVLNVKRINTPNSSGADRYR